jgi:deoxyribodipyrimidine photolyase-related protein
MPNYAQMNVLENTDIFLDRQNQMNCMSHAINQSLDEAYAHHIQRFMVMAILRCLLKFIQTR